MDTQKNQRSPGRPRKSAADSLSARRQILLRPAELAELQYAAEIEGRSLNDLVRAASVRHARRVIKRAIGDGS